MMTMIRRKPQQTPSPLRGTPPFQGESCPPLQVLCNAPALPLKRGSGRRPRGSFVFLFLISLLSLTTSAQESTPIILNLQKVLELGKADNLTIKLYKQQQQLAVADLTKAREWWLPELNVGAQAHWLRGSAMNGDGNFFQNVNRNNLWIGAGLDASWNIGDEIFKVESAKLKAEATSHLTRKAKNEALLASIEAYFDLLLADVQMAAFNTLILQSDTIIEQLKAQVDAGIRYQSELLLAKSARAQLQVQKLITEAERTEHVSKLMEHLNLAPNTKVTTNEMVLAPMELLIDANSNALEKRPEIQFFGLQKKAILAERKTYTTGILLPRIDLQLYGSMFGSYASVLSPTGEINGSIGWNIPLSAISGGDVKRSKSLAAISELEFEATKQQINAEVFRTKSRITQMKQRLNIAQQAQQFASEALGQSAAREQLGTARPFEVFEAQKVYLSAKMQYLKTIADYNKEQYRLFVGLGNDL